MTPSPPGDTISDIMQENGISRRKLCCKLDITESMLSHLLTGVFHIDDDMAEKLSDVLGSTPAFWMNRERQYREALAEEEGR